MLSDIKTMMWKEFLHFRKKILNEAAALFVVAVVFGAIPLLVLLKQGNHMHAFSKGGVMVAGLLLAVQLYCSLISEGVFGDEINERTLRMLLTTPTNPMAIFVGKWLMLMIRSLVMISFVTSTQCVTIGFFGGELGREDIYWAACGAGLCILYSSYCVGANGVMSLVLRSRIQLRQMGLLVSLIPLVLVSVSMKFFGFNWALVFRVMVLEFVVLSILLFAGALLAFRMEKVRL